MDRRGSGFKKILDEYKKQPNYTEASKPEFNSDFDCFFLILKKIDGMNSEKTTPKTTQIGSKILVLISNNPKITRPEIAVILGISVDGVKYHLNNLKEDGLIVHVGPSNGGYWKVVE